MFPFQACLLNYDYAYKLVWSWPIQYHDVLCTLTLCFFCQRLAVLWMLCAAALLGEPGT